MSHWNYRVIRKHHPEPDSVTYHVHEVYYRDDGGIDGWTQESVAPMGETAEELREDIRYFMHAFRRPILEEKKSTKKQPLFLTIRMTLSMTAITSNSWIERPSHWITSINFLAATRL